MEEFIRMSKIYSSGINHFIQIIILSDELRKESITRAVLNNGEKVDYGYGWHLKTYNGEEIVYHGGSTQGFRNVIYRVPSKKFTVIILTNRNEGEPEKIADEIFKIYSKE